MGQIHFIGLFILVIIIGLTLLFTEWLGRSGKINPLVARKILHLVGVGGLAISPFFIRDYVTLLVISALFTVLLFIVVKKQWLVADIYQRKSWGIALFPLSFLILWVIFGENEPALVVYPMLILAFADAGAAIAGKRFGKKGYTVSGDQKTLAGSIFFGMITILIIILFPLLFQIFNLNLLLSPSFIGLPILSVLYGAFILAVLTAIMEGSTSGGWDNVTVPLMSAWLMFVLPWQDSTLLYNDVIAMLLLAFLGFLAFKKKWLDAGGALMAFVMGCVIYLAGGLYPLCIMAIFFATGSLLGKLNKPNTIAADFKSGRPRDFMQVLCNGGVGALCMVGYGFSHNQEMLTWFAVSVAISTSDTWSSELGIWANGKVVNIIGWKDLPAGISGGISWQGSLAGLAGAFCIASMCSLLGIAGFWWIGLGGFLGMMLDSILGSVLQARYRIKKGTDFYISDDAGSGERSVLEKGYDWMTNDLVNLFSNLLMTILAIIFMFLSTY